MAREKLFRGSLECTVCKQDPEAGWKREAGGLVQNEDGSFTAYCSEHKPEGFWQKACVVPTVIHFNWDCVTKLTIHKLDPNACDRRGTIITVEMKDVPNLEYMQAISIEVCQALMLMGRNCTIHQLGERGEQNHCWVEPNYHWERPATCSIRDKYWGQDQTEEFREICRLMARIHNWELVDETIDLLTRIVKAIGDDDQENLEL